MLYLGDIEQAEIPIYDFLMQKLGTRFLQILEFAQEDKLLLPTM